MSKAQGNFDFSVHHPFNTRCKQGCPNLLLEGLWLLCLYIL